VPDLVAESIFLVAQPPLLARRGAFLAPNILLYMETMQLFGLRIVIVHGTGIFDS